MVTTNDFGFWMNPALLGWTILLAPLAAAFLILLFGIHRPRLSAVLAIGALLISFIGTGRIFLEALQHPAMLPEESRMISTAVGFLSAMEVPSNKSVADTIERKIVFFISPPHCFRQNTKGAGLRQATKFLTVLFSQSDMVRSPFVSTCVLAYHKYF